MIEASRKHGREGRSNEFAKFDGGIEIIPDEPRASLI